MRWCDADFLMYSAMLWFVRGVGAVMESVMVYGTTEIQVNVKEGMNWRTEGWIWRHSMIQFVSFAEHHMKGR